MRIKWIVGCLCLCFVSGITAQDRSNRLKIAWQFRQKEKGQWLNKDIAGNVHADLFRNGIIPDPFYGGNEKQLQWIENEDWEYKGEFVVDSLQLNAKHAEICFRDLDTYARVYLNNNLIFSTDNMFREWKRDVRKWLKPGKNTLHILFEAPSKKTGPEALALPYKLPEGERVFARKAQFHYGWDWGPRFVTFGMGQAPTLEYWSDARIASMYYEIQKLRHNEAEINLKYKIEADKDINISLVAGAESKEGKRYTAENPVKLKPGINHCELKLRIENPELWWCNGLGNPHLYALISDIRVQNKLLNRQLTLMGLRKIELITDKDSLGSTFYFKLNDKAVFIKGANYIPQHSFEPLVNKDNTIKLVQDAKNAGMNLLRVWGGGLYANDWFYEACDKKGILVWQDFMFACAMYPGDKQFMKNVELEVLDQVTRLRNHPSLALWCGNNENDEAWKNWGWQKQFAYSKADSSQIWKNYVSLFHDLIPGILKQQNVNTAYWPSSPSVGWGHPESLRSGDSHYWGVWWGNEEFDVYKKKVGRFMSEYGFQSLPDYSSFAQFCPDSQLTLNSACLRAHQKHPRGFEIIEAYMQRDYKVPVQLRRFIYVSQLLQRDGMKTAIEAHRASKPYCMGTLFWQLNDCWPVTSWSAMDHYRTPKALLFECGRVYKNFMLRLSNEDKQFKISAVSDSLETILATLELQLMDFKGTNLWSRSVVVPVNGSSVSLHTINPQELPPFDTATSLMRARLVADKRVLAENNYFFAKPKHLKLPETSINIQHDGKGLYTIWSDVFVKDLYLFSEKTKALFSDNYFNLFPGEKKQVRLLNYSEAITQDKIKTLSLNDF